MSSPFEVFRSPITIYRKSGGQYVDGYWEEGTTETISSTASIQALSGTKNNTSGIEENMNAFGRNNTKVFTLYTSTYIRTVEEQNPDRVEIFGDLYEVQQVKPWQNNLNFAVVNHYKYVAMALSLLEPND